MSIATEIDPNAVARVDMDEKAHTPIAEVEDRLLALPSAEDLAKATRLSLADLIEFGSEETQQATGTWGSGEQVCALSTAAIGLSALRKK